MKAILEVFNLTKSFRSLKAVDDVSFSIPKGSCFGLLGPNGAGKTTTIEIIEGIKKPTTGKILYKGKERNSNFSSEMGIQFQTTALMDYLTTYEVLKLFSKLYRHTKSIDELIEICQLDEFLGTYATKLSGGQRQRIAIARAILKDPSILLLDEATSALDANSEQKVQEALKRLMQGRTTLIIAHRLATIMHADRILLIDNGCLVAEGTHQNLLASSELYKRLCELQFNH